MAHRTPPPTRAAAATRRSSVLHHRLDHWAEASGRRATADRIAGLFPRATRVEDIGMRRALDEREQLIEARALDLASRAIQNQEPWLQPLSAPPSGPDAHREWLSTARTLAAYRDYWQTELRTDPNPAASSAEQTAHLQAALQAQERQRSRRHEPQRHRSQLDEAETEMAPAQHETSTSII